MKSIGKKFASCRSSRYWFVAELCLMLGLLWASTPVIHGLAHFAELDHRHADGSLYDHDGFAGSPRVATSKLPQTLCDVGHSDTGTSPIFDVEDSEESDGQDRRKPDCDELFNFCLLEIVGFETCEFDVSYLHEPIVGEKSVVTNIGFVFSAELGTIGPRGPPNNQAS